jgi:hypothetical protein
MSVQIEMPLPAEKFPEQTTEGEKPPISGLFSYKKSTLSRHSGNSFFIFGAAYAQE